jgi:hypothetical protein
VDENPPGFLFKFDGINDGVNEGLNEGINN